MAGDLCSRSDRASRSDRDTGKAAGAGRDHQHAWSQEPLPAAAEKRGAVSRDPQRAVRIDARSDRHPGDADDRAQLSSGAAMAVEESAADHGETQSHPEPQTRIRPRPGRMVRLKIAIAGTRGIPARYGGFETFAEELSARLVERGHFVSVYCRESVNRESGVGGRSVSDSSPTPDTRH